MVFSLLAFIGSALGVIFNLRTKAYIRSVICSVLYLWFFYKSVYYLSLRRSYDLEGLSMFILLGLAIAVGLISYAVYVGLEERRIKKQQEQQ